jgi:hypothetical protein
VAARQVLKIDRALAAMIEQPLLPKALSEIDSVTDLKSALRPGADVLLHLGLA